MECLARRVFTYGNSSDSELEPIVEKECKPAIPRRGHSPQSSMLRTACMERVSRWATAKKRGYFPLDRNRARSAVHETYKPFASSASGKT